MRSGGERASGENSRRSLHSLCRALASRIVSPSFTSRTVVDPSSCCTVTLCVWFLSVWMCEREKKKRLDVGRRARVANLSKNEKTHLNARATTPRTAGRTGGTRADGPATDRVRAEASMGFFFRFLFFVCTVRRRSSPRSRSSFRRETAAQRQTKSGPARQHAPATQHTNHQPREAGGVPHLRPVKKQRRSLTWPARRRPRRRPALHGRPRPAARRRRRRRRRSCAARAWRRPSHACAGVGRA